MRPILIGVVIVAVVIGLLALALRSEKKAVVEPHPYLSNLKISDLKMSAAQNFVGATVSYIDGNVTNTGDKTVLHAMVQCSSVTTWVKPHSAKTSRCAFFKPLVLIPTRSTSTSHHSLLDKPNPSASRLRASPPSGTINTPTSKSQT